MNPNIHDCDICYKEYKMNSNTWEYVKCSNGYKSKDNGNWEATN